MTTIHELEEKYDPDNDTMPGLPDISWGDYQLLQLIKNLEKRIAKMEKSAKSPDPLSQALNEGDGVYRP